MQVIRQVTGKRARVDTQIGRQRGGGRLQGWVGCNRQRPDAGSSPERKPRLPWWRISCLSRQPSFTEPVRHGSASEEHHRAAIEPIGPAHWTAQRANRWRRETPRSRILRCLPTTTCLNGRPKTSRGPSACNIGQFRCGSSQYYGSSWRTLSDDTTHNRRF